MPAPDQEEPVRAIVQDRYGGADVLELRDVDMPTPGDDEVLVQVHAAGLDPGVWHLMTGLPYLVRLGFGLRRPRTGVLGTDVAGRVEALGRNVTQFQPGDEVFGSCRGSFADYAIARAHHLAPKPAALGFEQAAAVPVSGITALQALRDKARVRAGQQVLVTGAGGGVGTFAVQLARAFDAEVTGVCSTAKLDTVRSIGASHVIDYTREDFTQSTRRYDAIVDTAGNRPLLQFRRALTPRGSLVIVGGEGGGRWLGGVGRLLRALLLSPFVTQQLRPFLAAARNEDLESLKELVEAGKLAPVIDRIYPLQEVAEAVRHLEQGHARGKVVIRVVEP
jgi:NADPH:quinone reductase-like Zn-dependent oxidoreductase